MVRKKNKQTNNPSNSVTTLILLKQKKIGSLSVAGHRPIYKNNTKKKKKNE